jgi:hypothetical protein
MSSLIILSLDVFILYLFLIFIAIQIAFYVVSLGA